MGLFPLGSRKPTAQGLGRAINGEGGPGSSLMTPSLHVKCGFEGPHLNSQPVHSDNSDQAKETCAHVPPAQYLALSTRIELRVD